LFQEDLKADPNALIREVLRGLGVDQELSLDGSERFNEAAVPRNATLNRFLVRSGVLRRVKDMVPRSMRGGFKDLLYSKESMPSMSPAQAQELGSYYADDVARLSELIGRDLRSIWPCAHAVS
ncbi:MAG: hypothetical protein ABI373_08640, partial [Flavobacteriales bacterium]